MGVALVRRTLVQSFATDLMTPLLLVTVFIREICHDSVANISKSWGALQALRIAPECSRSALECLKHTPGFTDEP